MITEIATARRRGRILSGEGFLTPIRPVVWRGERLEPGRDRVAPDHDSVRELGARLFRACMRGDRDPRVRAALRAAGRCPGSYRREPAAWQLPRHRTRRRENWRLR